jgi:transposase
MPKKKKVLINGIDPNTLWLGKCKELSDNSWLPTNTRFVGGGNSNRETKTSPLIINSHVNTNNVITESNIHDTEICGGNVLIDKLKETKKKGLQKNIDRLHGKLSKKDPSLAKGIVNDDIEEFVIASKCIRVTPIDFQSKHKINDAIAACRKIYNLCVHESHSNANKKLKMVDLRSKFVEKSNMSDNLKKNLDWTFRTPQKIRAAVPARFCSNFSTAKEELKKNPYRYKKKDGKVEQIKKKIQMRFKDTDKETQVIYLSNEVSQFRICEITGKTILKAFGDVELILDEHYNKFDTSTKCMTCQNIFTSKATYRAHLNRITPCKSQKPVVSGRPQMEIILQRVGYDYYIYVPEYKQLKIKSQAKNDMVAVDVGLNTLLTYYSPDTEWGEICPGMKQRVDKIRIKINKLKSLQEITRDQTKIRKFKKAVVKRTLYIKNMIDDIHWKMCHWLLSKFRKIVISRLYVSKSNRDTKQSFADLRLCTFVDRLTQKSIEYANSEIHICKEHYTSQACTRCLSLNTVKDSTVRCKDCQLEIHRDLNGARNIYLKHCY